MATKHMLDSVAKFKGYSLSKQLLISSAAVTGASVAYGVMAYCYNLLRYDRAPQIHDVVHGDIDNNDGILIFIHGFPGW